jgi:hypothetical protein
MTQFMLAHPFLFTLQIGFVCLTLTSGLYARGAKVENVHHHYHYPEGGNNSENKH